MSHRHALAVFAAATRLGFKQAIGENLLLLGSFMTYATLVVAYAGVFRAIPAAELAAYGLTTTDLIWWLGLTEFVLFCSTSFHFRDMQHEIQSGQIDLTMTRPCPLWPLKLGEGVGHSCGRMLILLAPCLALVGYMAGDFRLGLTQIIGLAASALLSAPLLACSFFIVGASCQWLRQAEPMYWIWQKSLFLLGAMLWPLALYPIAISRLTWLTPFPAVLATPAQWGQATSAPMLAAMTLHQIFWVGLFILAAARVDRALLASLQKGGSQ
jgi:ABC-2 type transport system permease protein